MSGYDDESEDLRVRIDQVARGVERLRDLEWRLAGAKRDLEIAQRAVRHYSDLIAQVKRVSDFERGVPLIVKDHPDDYEVSQAGPDPERRAHAYAHRRERGTWSVIGAERSERGWVERTLLDRGPSRAEAVALARRFVSDGEVGLRLRGLGKTRISESELEALRDDIARLHAADPSFDRVETEVGSTWYAYRLVDRRGRRAPYAAVNFLTGDLAALTESGNHGEPVGNLLAGDPFRGRAALRAGSLARLADLAPDARAIALALRARTRP